MLRKIAFGTFLLLTALSIVFALRNDKSVTTSSDEAYSHYLAGVDLIDKFYFRQAAKELEQAVALDSAFALAEMRLSACYRQLGFDQKGEEMSKRTLAHRSQVSPREQMLIDMWKANLDGNSESAYKLAQQYVAEYPKYREGYVHLGETEFARSNWKSASELYQKALEIDPTYAPAYNMLGYLSYYLGQYDAALAALAKYIELAPDQANPHDSRGEILFAVGRYEDAVAEFRQAFNISPDFDFAVLHMADAYTALGQVSQADNCFQLLANEPASESKQCEYLVAQSKSLIDREDYDSALSILRRVQTTDSSPDRANAFNAFYYEAVAFYRQRNLDGLVKAWDEAKQIAAKPVGEKPAWAAVWKRTLQFMDATTADLKGDFDNAAALCGERLDSTTLPYEKISTRTLYAGILWRKGQNQQAKAALQENLIINPNHTRSLILLADICQSDGEEATALTFYQRALAVWKNADPNFIPLVKLQTKINSPVATTPKQRST
jgi:tetratricopeptide (TPR) repeat protein